MTTGARSSSAAVAGNDAAAPTSAAALIVTSRRFNVFRSQGIERDFKKPPSTDDEGGKARNGNDRSNCVWRERRRTQHRAETSANSTARNRRRADRKGYCFPKQKRNGSGGKLCNRSGGVSWELQMLRPTHRYTWAPSSWNHAQRGCVLTTKGDQAGVWFAIRLATTLPLLAAVSDLSALKF
jgi:hypothetical protein